ncbi:MAG: class I tRNA ligase family protein [Defluviitaleaceae bacterium]|nr:class I tRNA ligase family protein [Defluviitaleaceae bacterium]
MNSSPHFPKRAVVTGGMPYGDKHLHSGHIGGLFIHADIYARFLRDRIGKGNVIFISGTDCYGAGPEVKYQAIKEAGFSGTIADFVEGNHKAQKKVLNDYNISLNLYGASALYEGGRIQNELSAQLFEAWYKSGYLRLEEVEQFYDEENQVILNGRQVEGRCPIAKCKSNTAYADECELGHQYSPGELIAPKIVTTGQTPSLKAVKNWYFDLERFGDDLKERQTLLEKEGISRKILLTNVADFLKDPAILIKTEDLEDLHTAMSKMPAHEADVNEENKSATITFKVLKDREAACTILREHGIRFRTGTTLVPFRLTGNVKWGIPVPEKEDITDQTFWVWPESLWIPMAFVQAYLKESTGTGEDWEKWWFDQDTRVYQFIGEDNIYFYAVAAMGLFMALNEIAGRPVQEALPIIIPNRHLYFGNRKASSSGDVKPPGAEELLNHYTVEQLRMHFAHMALHGNSISFKPQAIMGGEGFDATLAEGNILTNVYNRLIRSCFYTMQKYYDGKLPAVEVSAETKQAADKIISEYEWAMYRFELAKIIDMLDVYLRDANKTWSAQIKKADTDGESGESLRAQTLVDAFHIVRVAAVLLHPFAPEGTERVREFLSVDERLWEWTYINEPLPFFLSSGHNFKFLEPKVDFFTKHPSQLK